MFLINSINFITSTMPWIWLTVFVICIIVESLTFSLTTIWSGFAAFIMIFLSKLAIPLKWQILIFIILTVVFLFVTRPIALKFLKNSKARKINSLIDQEVVIVKKIKPFEKGEAKTSNGVVWNVKSEDNTEIPEKTICKVTNIEGNTLTVKQK